MKGKSLLSGTDWQDYYRLSRFVDKLPAALGHLSMAQLARDSLELDGELVNGDEGDHHIAWFTQDVVTEVFCHWRRLVRLMHTREVTRMYRGSGYSVGQD